MDRPKTRYARTGELSIAYQVHGEGEHDILFNGTVAANVDTAWRFPEAVRLFERLERFARLIRFDRRDQGLSDPVKDDLTLEAHAADALAVMDAVGSERPVLLGGLDGARSLAVLAATHPDRAGALVAFGPSPASVSVAVPQLAGRIRQALASPGSIMGTVTTMLASEYAADPVRADRLERGLQSGITPLQAERFFRMGLASDVTEVLPLVQAPTLVLRPVDSIFPAAVVRRFADLIPGALYREIPGKDLLIHAIDPDVLADAIEEFVTGTTPAPVTDRILATVLFTDLVDSTRRAAQAGDRAWADTLERHLASTRATVETHGGQTIKATGDGILALFTGPAQGVRCAQSIINGARDLDLDLRTGLHTGEVERTSDDVAGLAVHLAARIMNLAEGGEVLVSRTVRDLVIGSELTFTDRGEHELKGIPDRWALYSAA